MRVRELPEDYVEIFNSDFQKNKKSLPDNIGELLSLFHKDYLMNSNNVWLGYTDEAVVVRCFNKISWTKAEHDDFCREFDLILYAKEYVESYSPSGFECESNWIYLPRPAQEYVELLSIDFSEVL